MHGSVHTDVMGSHPRHQWPVSAPADENVKSAKRFICAVPAQSRGWLDRVKLPGHLLDGTLCAQAKPFTQSPDNAAGTRPSLATRCCHTVRGAMQPSLLVNPNRYICSMPPPSRGNVAQHRQQCRALAVVSNTAHACSRCAPHWTFLHVTPTADGAGAGADAVAVFGS